MTFTALTVILIATVLVSLKAMNDPSMKEKWMYSPYQVKHSKESYRIISHIFIHADAAHLMFNMFTLYFLGSQALEPMLMHEYGAMKGELHVVAIYFIGALFATIIPFYRNQDNYEYRALGASGAVSAIVFAMILWWPDMELYLMFIPIPIPAYWFGIFYLAYEIYMARKGNTGIAHDAHIGGAILGIIYILVINPEKGSNFINVIISAIS